MDLQNVPDLPSKHPQSVLQLRHSQDGLNRHGGQRHEQSSCGPGRRHKGRRRHGNRPIMALTCIPLLWHIGEMGRGAVGEAWETEHHMKLWVSPLHLAGRTQRRATSKDLFQKVESPICSCHLEIAALSGHRVAQFLLCFPG
ncbi:hypothetical protein AMECASPLE_021955 [Ameca splendens]|uniref:Uncharacterized protein n=1 Tax=Ameca splendens TaxID=208324 RepID=A0ABV0Y3P2_9TELE